MSKKRQSPPSNSSANANKSPVEVLVAKYGLVGTIVTAFLGLLGIAITAYFTYLVTRTQIVGPIEATQTAEARLADPIQSTSLPTVASSETPLLPTDTSIMALTIQSTSVAIVAPTQSPTLTPVASTVSSRSIACITSQQGIGVPAEVKMDSLTYSSITVPPGAKLPLANGEEILFSSMKSFEVIEAIQNPPRVRVTITLLNGDTITEDVQDATYYFDHLRGETQRSSFSRELYEVKRVEFRDQGGCQ
jgi:hypothetical protein